MLSVSFFSQSYGVFPLPDSDSYTNSYSDSYEIGFNKNVQNCFHLT